MLLTCRLVCRTKAPITLVSSQGMRNLMMRLPAATTTLPITSAQTFTSSAGCLAKPHICTTSTPPAPATGILSYQGQTPVTFANPPRVCRPQDIRCTHTTAIHGSSAGRARVGYGLHIHGRRTLRHVYTERLMPWSTQEEVTEMLKDNIIYQDDYVVAINKPNQLPMHALKYSEFLPLDVPPPEAAELSMQSSLKPLAKHFGVQELHKSFSQNRLHSGIVVLAKHKEVADRLRKYFRHVRAQNVLAQKFWVITVGAPHPAVGHEQFAMERTKLGDRIVSVKCENPSQRKRQAGKVVIPEVCHATLDHNGGLNAALVEIQCASTKWDVLQLYCMHKLSPILGDTVYSSRVHLVSGQPVMMGTAFMKPGKQVFPVEWQHALDLDPGNDLVVPLHAHCCELRLPDLDHKKKIVTVRAPPPDVFVWSLEALRLQIPTPRTEHTWT